MQVEVASFLGQVRLNLHDGPLGDHTELVHHGDLGVAASLFRDELKLSDWREMFVVLH